MSEPVTNHEVHIWLQGRFPNFKQRGPITQAQADAYNAAHPDRPYEGPVKKTGSWARINRMTPDGNRGDWNDWRRETS